MGSEGPFWGAKTVFLSCQWVPRVGAGEGNETPLARGGALLTLFTFIKNPVNGVPGLPSVCVKCVECPKCPRDFTYGAEMLLLWRFHKAMCLRCPDPRMVSDCEMSNCSCRPEVLLTRNAVSAPFASTYVTPQCFNRLLCSAPPRAGLNLVTVKMCSNR